MCPKLQGDLRTEPEKRGEKHQDLTHLCKTMLEKPRVICILIYLLCFSSQILIDSVSINVACLPITEQGRASPVQYLIRAHHGGVLSGSLGTDWEKPGLGTDWSLSGQPHTPLCLYPSRIPSSDTLSTPLSHLSSSFLLSAAALERLLC